MPASSAPNRSAVRALLAQAYTLADALPEDHIERLATFHRIGLSAVDAGETAQVRQVLDVMDSPAHRAHLMAYLARRSDRRGLHDDAREWAGKAVDALDGAGRWRPVLPDWVGLDSARADLCALWVSLGDDPSAETVAAPIRAGTVWHACAVAALAHTAVAEEGWATVVAATRAIASSGDRAQAALQLLETGAPRPRLGPEASWSLSLIDAVVADATEAEAVLAGARVAARLARVLLDVPALTAAVDAWARATSLAQRLPKTDPAAVSVLCTVTRDQIRRVGPGPAAVTWQTLLDRLHDAPLPPDPPQWGPWAEVLALGLRHPSLCASLARVISRHPAVPSAWAHVLGLLHIRAGRPDRALRVADVLEAAARQHEEDHESQLLGALLRAQTGDGDGCWDALMAAIGPTGDRLIWLSGRDGPQPYELWAVDALLEGGSMELALLLARLVGAPGLRGQLLAHCLTRVPAGEGAAALAEEAADALAEAAAAGDALTVDASLALLPKAAWESGDSTGAEELLERLVGWLIPVSVPAWIEGLTHIQRVLDQLGPAAFRIAVPVTEGWERRVDSAEPEDAVELLLARVTLALRP